MKRFLPILMASLLLTSCSTAAVQSTITKAPSNSPVKDPYQITEIRTPTPTLPAGETVPPRPERPTPETGPGGNTDQPDKPQNAQDEMGNGAPLEGYVPLLEYIDQSSISHMMEWPNHETDDMFDGLFETTAIGSNKFGMNSSTVDVTWAMDRPVTIFAYVMYTANDTESIPERNPQSWTLYGSSDGKSYEKIHAVSDANLPVKNYAPTVFKFNNNKAYQYYRWSLEGTVGGGGFQLSELLLFSKKTPEAIDKPTNPEVNDKGLPAYGVAATGKDSDPLTQKAAENWMNSKTSLQNQVKKDSIYCSEHSFADNEQADRLFDGIYTEWRFAESGGGKMCSAMTEGHIYWEMKEAVTPSGYVLVTANDTDEYPGRNPISWVLYGATEDGEWVVLDAVKNGNMLGENFASHVYEIDNDKAYIRFCLVIEKTGADFQLCEIMLYQ